VLKLKSRVQKAKNAKRSILDTIKYAELPPDQQALADEMFAAFDLLVAEGHDPFRILASVPEV
jgi:hypothetical protein